MNTRTAMRIPQIVAVAAIALMPAALIQSIHGQATSAARPHISGISHLSVYTSDAAKTEYFYVHDLGGQKRDDPQNPAGVRYYFSLIQFIEVLPLPAGDTSNNRMDHMAFNTVNAEALRLLLAAHGITVPAQVEKGSEAAAGSTCSILKATRSSSCSLPPTPSLFR